MPRIDVNRSGEMEAFVQVVDKGGFSAAFPDELAYWQGYIRPSSRRTMVPGWQTNPLRVA